MNLEARHQAILEGERAAQAQLASIQLAIKNFKASARAQQPAPAAKL